MGTARSRAAGDTDPGLQREQNEDRFFFDEAKGVYCVIDGVGGHNAGERAAAIAADVLRASMARTSEADLRAAFARANDAIYASAWHPTLSGMACVLTLAAIGRPRPFGHVGDTRSTSSAAARSRSDTGPLAGRRTRRRGDLTETEAMRHPRRNEIYSDVGSRPPGPDVAASILTGEAPFEPDAALLLCSDGLPIGVVRIDPAHRRSLRRSPALAAQVLLTAANDAGGKDNVTVVIVEGERFAGAVTPRGPRRAGAPAAPAREPVTGASRRPVAVPPAAPRPTARAPPGPAVGTPPRPRRRAYPRRRRRPRGADVRLGSAAPLVAGASRDGPADLGGRPRAVGRVLQHRRGVGEGGAGDTVTVGPGEYPEAITLNSGVQLVGPRQPPQAAGRGRRGLDGDHRPRRDGCPHERLRHRRGPGQPLAIGLLAEAATISVDGLEISGARDAGVDLRAGGRVTLSHSLIRDNEGHGVIVRARAEPRLERNVIIHNGHGPQRRAGVSSRPVRRPSSTATASAATAARRCRAGRPRRWRRWRSATSCRRRPERRRRR